MNLCRKTWGNCIFIRADAVVRSGNPGKHFFQKGRGEAARDCSCLSRALSESEVTLHIRRTVPFGSRQRCSALQRDLGKGPAGSTRPWTCFRQLWDILCYVAICSKLTCLMTGSKFQLLLNQLGEASRDGVGYVRCKCPDKESMQWVYLKLSGVSRKQLTWGSFEFPDAGKFKHSTFKCS